MIKIRFFRNEDGILTGFETKGHAGYAEAGKDIICASVSVLVINTINSIDRFTTDKTDVFSDEAKGIIRFSFLNIPSAESTLLMQSLESGLMDIQKDYGKKYITIEK